MISLISFLSFPVTSIMSDESGTIPSNSRRSLTTQMGELVFVIKGSISSTTFFGTWQIPNAVSLATGGMAKMIVAKAPGTVPSPKKSTAGIR